MKGSIVDRRRKQSAAQNHLNFFDRLSHRESMVRGIAVFDHCLWILKIEKNVSINLQNVCSQNVP